MKKPGFWGTYSKMAVVLAWACCALQVFANTNPPPAKLSIKGYGFLGDRELKSLVVLLERSGKKPVTFEANFVEDAVLILFSRLNKDGYLHPKIHANIELADGEHRTFTWIDPVSESLPRPLNAKKVEFVIEKGVRFYYEEVRFSGINAISLRDAAHFFIEVDAIVKLKENRVYTPDKLRSSVRNLEEALERLGYESASALSTNLMVNTNTGVVTVDILVHEGPRSLVRSIRKEIYDGDTNTPPAVSTIQTNVIFSRLWQQDFTQLLRREQYIDGHADARAEITQEERELRGSTNYIDIAAKVWPGPVITVQFRRISRAEKGQR